MSLNLFNKKYDILSTIYYLLYIIIIILECNTLEIFFIFKLYNYLHQNESSYLTFD